MAKVNFFQEYTIGSITLDYVDNWLGMARIVGFEADKTLKYIPGTFNDIVAIVILNLAKTHYRN